MLNFMRHHQTFFPGLCTISTCTILHLDHQCIEALAALPPCQHFDIFRLYTFSHFSGLTGFWSINLRSFFNVFLKKLLIFGCAGSLVICGLFSSCGAPASHCSGFSPWEERAVGAWASVAVAHGLSCSVACGIFPDQESNLYPLHWQADSLPLMHQGSP